MFFVIVIIILVEIDKLEPNSELSVILKQRKQIFLTVARDENEKERKTAENLPYKSFQSNAYGDWVSYTAVEVIDVLDKVTHAQKFQVSYKIYLLNNEISLY